MYSCDVCGNLAFMLVASGVKPNCCGKEMACVQIKTVEEGSEKHVPQIEFINSNKMKVKVGSTLHPMSPQHYIQFICLETTAGCVVRSLCATDQPEVCLRFTGRPVAIYSYCNVHGLWKKTITKEDCPPCEPQSTQSCCAYK